MLTEALLKAAESFPTHPIVAHQLTPIFREFLGQYQDNNPGFPPPGFHPDIEFLDDLWELFQAFSTLRLKIVQLVIVFPDT